MEDETITNDEVLILADQEGNLYVIPREIVESYMASAEQKAEIVELLGQEVTGFQMPRDYLVAELADYHQRERRQEAARERMIRIARAEENEQLAPQAAQTHATGVGNLLTGMWRRLHTAGPARHPGHAR